jgi:tRNA-Thr(GGU) m(6)t(6)A37 methyltransferase TsaA
MFRADCGSQAAIRNPFCQDVLSTMNFTLRPIGWIRKTKARTKIVLYKKYQPGLMGVAKRSEIWVLWWFHRNDTPRLRSILKVHPRGNPANPLRGVFATRAPMRPNLIGLTRCKVLAVKKNVIEIDSIDAFPDTPVLDLKP